MNEFKGTKGKWTVSNLNDNSGLHAIFSSSSNTLIARTCYMPFSKANAQLISKAPEMLEMLKLVKEGINTMDFAQLELLYDDLEQLIQSATELKQQ